MLVIDVVIPAPQKEFLGFNMQHSARKPPESIKLTKKGNCVKNQLRAIVVDRETQLVFP